MSTDAVQQLSLSERAIKAREQQVADEKSARSQYEYEARRAFFADVMRIAGSVLDGGVVVLDDATYRIERVETSVEFKVDKLLFVATSYDGLCPNIFLARECACGKTFRVDPYSINDLTDLGRVLLEEGATQCSECVSSARQQEAIQELVEPFQLSLADQLVSIIRAVVREEQPE